MSYAVQATVISLCQNQLTNPGQLFTVASGICDSKIDAYLSTYFFWPYNNQDVALNNPPPPYIVTMANLYTAAIIESIGYSQTMGFKDVALDSLESGGGSTYARYLYGEYKQMLKDLIRGGATVNQLVRYSSAGSAQAKDTFRLTLGLAEDTGFAENGSGGEID